MSNRLTNILLGLVLCAALNLGAQPLKFQYGFIPTYGVSYQPEHWNGEVGIAWGFRNVFEEGELPHYNYGLVFYPKLSTEFYFDHKYFFVGPKATTELSCWFLSARTSIVDYIGEHSSDARFVPELGLRLPLTRGVLPINWLFYGKNWRYTYSNFSIYYGYNVPIKGSRIDNIPGNRITVVFNPILVK